jgi:hypothetical protein
MSTTPELRHTTVLLDEAVEGVLAARRRLRRRHLRPRRHSRLLLAGWRPPAA